MGVVVDAARYRHVLGHFCTGVTVVTSISTSGQPVGFACQSFAALSLDPPLVLFCPTRTSSSWPHIAAAGSFVVNVLADDQRDLSRRFGLSGGDKFAGVGWRPSPIGAAPILDGALAWMSCTVESVVDGGDHHIVIGRVTELGEPHDGRPLLFYRGRYTSAAENSPHDPPEVVDTLLSWGRHDDWM